jgi:aspartyl-tRNA(Asn)/glutamyl-tRNA(Gln) amidotransferase subunit A
MLMLSVLETIDALGAGELSASELLALQMERIEQMEGKLHAYLHVDPASARLAAEASDRRRAAGEALHPLDGVPCAIKDNIDVAGMPTSAGMASRRERVASTDAASVARLRKAGAVILGKLHLQEAALGADGANPHFERCQNPHRHGHVPGGSSSGSAVAVAAGLCSFSLGSDSMGSVRIPASYCGVVGFKPSHGRVSQRGLVRVSRRLDQIGLLVRQAADLPMLFQAISGLDPADPQSRSVPLLHSERSDSQLRLGRLTGLAALGVESAVSERYEQVCSRLAEAFPPLREVVIDNYEFGRTRRAGLLLCEAEMLVEHAHDWHHNRSSFSPELQRLLDFAAGRSAADLIAAERELDQAITLLRGIFSELDVLLTPTTPQPAFPHGASVPVNQADLTSIANFAGMPALSLPMGQTVDGLPLGLQLIGPVGSDLQLMALAARIEAVLA